MKMVLKNIGCLLLLAIVWVSCNDDDNVKIKSSNPVRVKEIVGHNDHWGDYTLKLEYENEKIAKLERFDKNEKKKGELAITKEQGVLTYSFVDYVYNIDADSIVGLDQQLEKQFGAGNYSLEDYIPLIGRTLYEVALEFNGENMVTKQKISYYTPKKDFGVGSDFDNTFPLERVETYVYEIGENREILNVRAFVDIYSPESAQNYVSRDLYKYEYDYRGSQVVANRIYGENFHGEENWNLLHDLTYMYSGENLASVKGEGYSLERNYSNNRVFSLMLNGETTSCTLNEYGFLMKSDNGEGEMINVSYEVGNGNFSQLYRLDQELKGLPVIK